MGWVAKSLIGMLLFFGLVTDASAERRIALVIGNSDYEHTPVLKNPINDAIDISAKLTSLGFTVIRGLNLDYSDLQDKMRKFTNAIESADVALFYYAGHGVQVEGKNYLIPVSASLEKESDIDFQTIPLNLILRQMARQKRTNLVFLDACRNNPLASSFARKIRSASRSRAIGISNVGRGLARVESGLGMMISYATSPGDVALDGDHRNSPYTTALLKHLDTPGVNINDLMISVRRDVLEQSNGQQIPWENSSLLGHFYFKEKVQQSKPDEQHQPTIVSPSPRVQLGGGNPSFTPPSTQNNPQMVIAAFEATRSIGTCGSYRAFKKQFGKTFYAVLATEWISKNCSTAAALSKETMAPTRRKQNTPGTRPKFDRSAALDPVAPHNRAQKRQIPAITSRPPVLSGRKLIIAQQVELKRVRCTSGKADGVWGKKSVAAMKIYNKAANANLTTGQASMPALEAIRLQRGRICGTKHRIVNKCAKGQYRSRRGTCVRRPKTVRYAPAKTNPKASNQNSNNLNIFRNTSKDKKVFGMDDNPSLNLEKLVTDAILGTTDNPPNKVQKRKRQRKYKSRSQRKQQPAPRKCKALIFNYECPVQ